MHTRCGKSTFTEENSPIPQDQHSKQDVAKDNKHVCAYVRMLAMVKIETMYYYAMYAIYVYYAIPILCNVCTYYAMPR